MFVLQAQSSIDLHWLFQFLVSDYNRSLFGSNHKFAGSFGTVFEGSGSHLHLLAFRVVVSNHQGLNSVFFQFSSVPKVGISVRGNGHTIKACFGHLPLKVSDGIVVRLLNVGCGHGFFPFAVVPNGYDTICATSANNISQLVVEGQVGDRGR